MALGDSGPAPQPVWAVASWAFPCRPRPLRWAQHRSLAEAPRTSCGQDSDPGRTPAPGAHTLAARTCRARGWHVTAFSLSRHTGCRGRSRRARVDVPLRPQSALLSSEAFKPRPQGPRDVLLHGTQRRLFPCLTSARSRPFSLRTVPWAASRLLSAAASRCPAWDPPSPRTGAGRGGPASPRKAAAYLIALPENVLKGNVLRN